MSVQEIIESIRIGFDKPKFYKRSVWNQSVKIMEFLSDNTEGEIVRTNLGLGLEKYRSTVPVNDEQLAIWALAYKRNLNQPVTLQESVPELNRIARELGVKACNPLALKEYLNKYQN